MNGVFRNDVPCIFLYHSHEKCYNCGAQAEIAVELTTRHAMCRKCYEQAAERYRQNYNKLVEALMFGTSATLPELLLVSERPITAAPAQV